MTRSFKVLSALLSYPEVELIEACSELQAVIDEEGLIEGDEKSNLLGLIGELRRGDLISLQEQYVALFDRGRNLSLHIFEHVHGESRDRGQAMVDLMDEYRRKGLWLDARELPDYIPLFFEFLSQIDYAEACRLLRDAMPVLSLIGARLGQRGSRYASIFDALSAIAGCPDDIDKIRERAATEGEDPTLADMDKIWEEEAVTFMDGGQRCSTDVHSDSTPPEATLHWMPKPGTPDLARALNHRPDTSGET